ncbi:MULTISPECIES: hypothetical protein [unclassified Arthrobacter]|uniref:hypothetical protein n=1 Tax=unclassified Arthrobacter TaxID=235627 RepID=UPI002E12AC26
MISAGTAAGEEDSGLEGDVVIVGEADVDCFAADGAAAVEGPEEPGFPQPERASAATAAAVSPSAQGVLMFSFKIEPFVGAAVIAY